jgi:hypothetical protein
MQKGWAFYGAIHRPLRESKNQNAKDKSVSQYRGRLRANIRFLRLRVEQVYGSVRRWKRCPWQLPNAGQIFVDSSENGTTV